MLTLNITIYLFFNLKVMMFRFKKVQLCFIRIKFNRFQNLLISKGRKGEEAEKLWPGFLLLKEIQRPQ